MLATVALLLFLLDSSKSVKILEFSANRSDGSGATLRDPQTFNITDHTLCIDMFMERIRNHLPIGSKNDGYSTPLSIPSDFNRVGMKLKGIWFIAYTEEIQPFKWSTYCYSYKSNDKILMITFNGVLLLKNQESLIPDGSIVPTFLEDIILGKKDS